MFADDPRVQVDRCRRYLLSEGFREGRDGRALTCFAQRWYAGQRAVRGIAGDHPCQGSSLSPPLELGSVGMFPDLAKDPVFMDERV